MKVARSELMFATPTLAKMAVNAAKIAESTAHNCQVENTVEFTNLRSHRRHRAFRSTVLRGQDATVRPAGPASTRLHPFGFKHGHGVRRGDELYQVAGRLLVRRLGGNSGGEHDVGLYLRRQRSHQLGAGHRKYVGN